MGSSPILGDFFFSIYIIVSCYGAFPVEQIRFFTVWSAVANLPLKKKFLKDGWLFNNQKEHFVSCIEVEYICVLA